ISTVTRVDIECRNTEFRSRRDGDSVDFLRFGNVPPQPDLHFVCRRIVESFRGDRYLVPTRENGEPECGVFKCGFEGGVQNASVCCARSSRLPAFFSSYSASDASRSARSAALKSSGVSKLNSFPTPFTDLRKSLHAATAFTASLTSPAVQSGPTATRHFSAMPSMAGEGFRVLHAVDPSVRIFCPISSIECRPRSWANSMPTP